MTPDKAPEKAGAKLTAWLNEGNHKYLAAGGAAVLGFALYERKKNAATPAVPAAATIPPTTPTTVPSSSSVASLGSLDDQVENLSRGVASLQHEEATERPVTPPNSVPLAPSSNFSVDRAHRKDLDKDGIAAAIPAHGGDGIYYLGVDGAVINEGKAPFYGSPREQHKEGKFRSIMLTTDGGYSVVDEKGTEYHYGPQKPKVQAAKS